MPDVEEHGQPDDLTVEVQHDVLDEVDGPVLLVADGHDEHSILVRLDSG